MPEPRKLVPVDYRTLIQVFERVGFAVSRQKGDHISMTKPGVFRPLVIKTSPRKVPVAHIRTNMTTAGMSRERFFELLDAVS
jgi:predicted RNA binding protein YcfA (HicA-like mRNA interferase family)